MKLPRTASLALLGLFAACAAMAPTDSTRSPKFYYLGMHGLAYSPDGMLLAVLRSRDRADILNAATLGPVYTLRRTEGRAASDYAVPAAIAFSRDGKLVAIAGIDDRVKVWDTHTWGIVGHLPDSQGVTDVAFLPGDLLATAGPGALARVWNAKSATLVFELRGDQAAFTSIAASSDGKLLATGGTDRVARVWDIGSRRAVDSFDQKIASVISLAFSPDGKHLVTSAGGYGAVLWELDWPRDARPPAVQPGTYPVLRALTPNVFVLGDIGFVQSPTFFPVGFSPDGKLLGVMVQGGMQVYSMTSPSYPKVADHFGLHSTFAFSPDGRTLAAMGYTGLRLIDMYTGKELRKVQLPR
jgi:WD40 repeat protein